MSVLFSATSKKVHPITSAHKGPQIPQWGFAIPIEESLGVAHPSYALTLADVVGKRSLVMHSDSECMTKCTPQNF